MLSDRGRLGLFGGLASGNLLINIPWPRIVFRGTGWFSIPDIAYLDDILVAIGSIFSGTVAGPLIGTGITFLLVLGIMYQTVPQLEIRNIAQLYTTRRFRLLLTFVAGGFGVVWILFFGELAPFVRVSDSFSVGLLGGWTVVGVIAVSLYFASKADPTSPNNPIVGLLSSITGSDQATYRRTQVTESWAPVWISGPAAIIAAAFVLTIITFLLGLVVAIAVRAYPLPEILVLTWIFTQLVGVHRLPYLRWLKNIEIEQQVYERFGSGTTTFYGIMVALAYLAVLSIATALFAIVGIPLLIHGITVLSEQVSSSNLADLFTSADQLVRYLLLLMYTISPLIAGIHWIAYWILALLRLPSVTIAVLPGRNSEPRPKYRRLEGLTLPGSTLLVWAALYGRFEAYSMAMWLQALFIILFYFPFITNAWTLYRAIWADLDPQPPHSEERVIRLAVSVQALSLIVAFILTDVGSPLAIVVMGSLLIGFVVICQYLPRVMHLTDADEPASRVGLILVVVSIILIPVFHLAVPQFSPIPQVILISIALIVTVSAIMTHRHR